MDPQEELPLRANVGGGAADHGPSLGRTALPSDAPADVVDHRARAETIVRRIDGASLVLSVPVRGIGYPVAWRGLTAQQWRERWLDLAEWVDWLIEAYRLSPTPWHGWWLCPGGCEELAALRAWHRELVDIHVTALSEPIEPGDPERQIAWFRHEQSLRQDRARSQVDWHDALWRILSRLVGIGADQKPLLTREDEATERTARIRDEEVARRREAFALWLDGSRSGAGEV